MMKLTTSITMLSIAMINPAFAEDPAFSSGLATTIIDGLIDCGRTSRVSAVGQIVAEDGSEWTVPAATNYQTAPHAADLYNECAGVETNSLSDFDINSVEVIDAGGSENFTVYIFADNYFELYVNGKLIAVDPVPFTPFNSNVVRFKADRPVSLAIMGVDWEENLALGSEQGRGSSFSPGDAGIVARILDDDNNLVAITDESWKAQTYYVSPLSSRDCLIVDGTKRDSSACSTKGTSSDEGLSAAYWSIPTGWYEKDFDASNWPQAFTYTNDIVGVDNKPAFTNFTEIFDSEDNDPQFIWSSNLVLDNLVLMRKTIE